jgi:hypothetical protein
MTIHNDYTAQIFYTERQSTLSANAAAAYQVRAAVRRSPKWAVSRPWWRGILDQRGRTGRHVSPRAA